MPYFSVLGMLKYDDSLVGQLTRCRALHNLCTSQVITTLISYRCHLIMTKKVMVMMMMIMNRMMLGEPAWQPCVHHQYFTHPMRQPVTLHIFHATPSSTSKHHHLQQGAVQSIYYVISDRAVGGGGRGGLQNLLHYNIGGSLKLIAILHFITFWMVIIILFSVLVEKRVSIPQF